MRGGIGAGQLRLGRKAGMDRVDAQECRPLPAHPLGQHRKVGIAADPGFRNAVERRGQPPAARRPRQARRRGEQRIVPAPGPQAVDAQRQHGQRAVPLGLGAVLEGQLPVVQGQVGARAGSADHILRQADGMVVQRRLRLGRRGHGKTHGGKQRHRRLDRGLAPLPGKVVKARQHAHATGQGQARISHARAPDRRRGSTGRPPPAARPRPHAGPGRGGWYPDAAASASPRGARAAPPPAAHRC